ncbi:MAG: hypothetical protein J6Z27_03200 [Bacteroidales bacterium]|nr:hypothetical protein [Bacteroidales bacterium]
MKRFYTVLLFSFLALVAYAQDNYPVGMRQELASVTQDNTNDSNTYSVFRYRGADGTEGYFLSLGRSFNIISIVSDIGSSSLDHIDETCIYLGDTIDGVYESLDKKLDVIKHDVCTTVNYPCKLVDGMGRLNGDSVANATVVKRFLQNKRLNIQFTSGRHTASVDLTPATIKSLRFSVNLSNKIVPQQ